MSPEAQVYLPRDLGSGSHCWSEPICLGASSGLPGYHNQSINAVLLRTEAHRFQDSPTLDRGAVCRHFSLVYVQLTQRTENTIAAKTISVCRVEESRSLSCTPMPAPVFLFLTEEHLERNAHSHSTPRMFSQVGALDGIKQPFCLLSLPPTLSVSLTLTYSCPPHLITLLVLCSTPHTSPESPTHSRLCRSHCPLSGTYRDVDQ